MNSLPNWVYKGVGSKVSLGRVGLKTSVLTHFGFTETPFGKLKLSLIIEMKRNLIVLNLDEFTFNIRDQAT